MSHCDTEIFSLRYYYGRTLPDVFVPEMDEFTNDDQILALLMADSEVFVLIFNYINIKDFAWVGLGLLSIQKFIYI